MKSRPFWFYRQSGVIPYRLVNGEVEILLVTSRAGTRWVIPKGMVEIGMGALESACKEAYEEAGIGGKAPDEAVGEYSYEKWGGTCTVAVYLLRVTTILDDWPESGERKRKWMTVDAAADAVREPELKKMIRRVVKKVRG